MAPTHGGFFLSTIECSQTATAPASAEKGFLEAEETLESEPSAKSMSNLTSASRDQASFSSETGSGCHAITVQHHQSSISNSAGAGSSRQHSGNKRKRNLPGNPDPEAEVIALSPKTLMATNRFVCEICGKGFQRDQNLQLHRRGHNLPWKLRQRTGKEVKKRVYVCPEQSCVHHDPSRALGDLTGIKKHFCRKHGEKKWKCDKCSKKYAVQSDWKAHCKTCGSREYRCDCGNLFSRRDSFITHRAFCDALAEESARISAFRPRGIQLPYTGQENNFGSAIAMSECFSLTNVAPSSRNIPNFLGMAIPPFDVAVSPPSRADLSSTRYGASSAESFHGKLDSNSTTNLVSPCPRMSVLSGPGTGIQGAGLSSSCNQMSQFINRLPRQSDRLMEAIKSHNKHPENDFQEPSRGAQRQNLTNSGKQLQYQSSFSTSHGNSAQEKLIGSLYSSVGPSDGSASKIQSPVQGQKFIGTTCGINMTADLELSSNRQCLQGARASPVAGIYLPSPAGLLGNLVSKNSHETTNGLTISSIHTNRQTSRPQMSATALLQKAALMGATFSDSSLKHCLDSVERPESIPNSLNLTSKVSSQSGDHTSLLRNLDSSVHSFLAQKSRLPWDLSPPMDHAMDSMLETRAISIGRSTPHSQGFQRMQQATSLDRCHARASSSLPFILGISNDKHINENNVVQGRNLIAASTSTTAPENITHGGEQMYGTVSCTRAPLPSLEGDTGRDQLIYERSTRDFLGVGGDTNGLRGVALGGNKTFLSQEKTGIALDLSPSMNSLSNNESINAWTLVGSGMGI